MGESVTGFLSVCALVALVGTPIIQSWATSTENASLKQEKIERLEKEIQLKEAEIKGFKDGTQYGR